MTLSTTLTHLERSDNMKKSFVLPEHTYEAEVFNSETNTWKTISVVTSNEESARQMIYLLMHEDDILLRIRNDRGYLI